MKLNKDDILTIFVGFFMTVANTIPGVSGSTIAYILGKYDQFIDSLSILTSKSMLEEKKGALVFLFKLALGSVVGLVASILILVNFINTKPYEMSSLFIGLILIGTIFIIVDEKIIQTRNFNNLIYSIIGFIIIVGVTYLSTNNIGLGETNSSMMYLYVILSGALALSAMLLPGISGSSFLLVLGVYNLIITSTKAIITLDFSNLDIMIAFGIGMLFGLVFGVKLIAHYLKKNREAVVYLILGMMLASLYSITLGPTTITDPLTDLPLNLAPLTLSTLNILYVLLGILIVAGLEFLKRYAKK